MGFGRLALGVAIALSCALPAIGAPSLIDSRKAQQLVRGAASAVLTSYELPAHGGMTAALAALCTRGGRADVILAGDRYLIGASAKRTVAASAATLTAAGCKVRRAAVPLHLKLLYLGPAGVFLADRNWGRNATIVRLDDPADRELIAATLRNQPGSNGTLATLKGAALEIEARTIATSHGALAVESESFGANNPVFEAIRAAAGAGRPIRLIVSSLELRGSGSASERAALAELVRAGVQIRAGRANAKLAVTDDALWLGSTNATAGYPDQIDWGRRLDSLRAPVRARFERDWESAVPI